MTRSKWTEEGTRRLRYTPERAARAAVRMKLAHARQGRKKTPILVFWSVAWSSYAMALVMCPIEESKIDL